MDKEAILNVLKRVRYPGYTRDIVSFGLVREVSPRPGGGVLVSVCVTTRDEALQERLQGEIAAALSPLPGGPFEVRVTREEPSGQASRAASGGSAAPAAAPVPGRVPGVARVIAVASGKGGVGKSTVAVNLACALVRHCGAGRVGLLDCDMHGPSVPLMTGLLGRAPETDGENILPLENHGLRIMSLGFLMDEEAPVVWRGPMIMKAIRQFASQVAWGGVDVLVVDLPPGTGDAPLSLAQTVQLDGVVVVTTPQPAAAGVARRGAELFRKLGVPLLGVVENMGGSPGAASIFGSGGGEALAAQLGAPLLAQIPLDASVREGGDTGLPVVLAAPEGAPAQAFRKLAARVVD